MTKQELQKFEDILQKKGYKKHSSMMDNDDYAWVKPFGKSKYEDDRSNYQVAFSIYNFSSSA